MRIFEYIILFVDDNGLDRFHKTFFLDMYSIHRIHPEVLLEDDFSDEQFLDIFSIL